MTQPTTIERAQQLIRAGKMHEARQLLEADQIQPACAIRLRELYLGEHENDKALKLARLLAVGHGAEAHVSRSIAAMMGGDLESAVAECENALGVDPGSAHAFNHLGRALQNSGHSLQALSALRKAVDLQPDYPEAWYNLGLVLRASGGIDEAINAYRKALEYAPGYRAAELNLGISLMLTNRVDEALFCFQTALAGHQDDVELLVNQGLALHTLGRIDEARESYQAALELDPQHAIAWSYMGILLHESLFPDEALQALERSLQIDPTDVEAWVEVASIHEQANRLDQAEEALRNGQRANRHHPALHLELARLHRRKQEIDEALSILQAMPVSSLPERIAQQYHFELAQALDRNGRYDEAMQAYAEGNRLLATNIRRRSINPQGFERRCNALEAWARQDMPGAQPVESDPAGDTGSDLCFLVGFPRSGTTLLDTMLDAHPDVVTLEEHATLEKIVEEVAALPRGYPDGLASLDPAEIIRLRAAYRDEVNAYMQGREAKLIVDKLPLRFLNLGLVQRLFPDARVLFALRHPCDVVLSNFMQAYAANEAFIHFDTLADSAAMYVRAMGLWNELDSRLTLNLLYTRYEDMVKDSHAEMARVCAHLGIEPVDSMFDHEQRMANRSTVRTTSYQQVAEPVYYRSVERWFNYRSYLEPVLPELEPFIAQFGYSPGGVRLQ